MTTEEGHHALLHRGPRRVRPFPQLACQIRERGFEPGKLSAAELGIKARFGRTPDHQDSECKG